MTELSDYLTTTAEDKARLFYNKRIEKNQLRKFYDDFKVLERKMLEEQEMNDDLFKKELLPYIKFVKSKIAYNAGRKQGRSNDKLVPVEYKKYMDEQIDKIETPDDFKKFLMHYQAIISYYNFISEVERGGNRKDFHSNKSGGKRWQS